MFNSIKNEYHYITAGVDKESFIKKIQWLGDFMKIILLFLVCFGVWFGVHVGIGEFLDILTRKTMEGRVYIILGFFVVLIMTTLSASIIMGIRNNGKKILENKMMDL
jgi:hypothetical protein